MNGGNVGIDNSSPAKLLHVGSSSLSTTVVARFENSSGACDHTPGASSETVACSSDERLKKNITDANNALADIMQLRIRQYDFRATDQHYNYGVIAQEVLQTPLASLVHTDDDGMYKVEVIDAWRLTKALQEMDIQINAIRPENLDNTAYTKIKEFLQGIAQNATATIDFVVSKKVTTDELQTKKLCIDVVCITKEQLQQVLGTQSTPSVVVPAAPVPAIADPVVPALVPTPVAPVEVPVEQPQ
jgi:hypothetical protein